MCQLSVIRGVSKAGTGPVKHSQKNVPSSAHSAKQEETPAANTEERETQNANEERALESSFNGMVGYRYKLLILFLDHDGQPLNFLSRKQ